MRKRGTMRGRTRGEGRGATGKCACPKCGYSESKIPGTPCMMQKCPKCGSVLLREGGLHFNPVKKGFIQSTGGRE